MLTVVLHNRTKTTTCLCLSKKCFNIVRLNSKNAVTGLDGFIPCFDLQQQQAHPQCISNPAPCTHTHTRLTAVCPGLPGWAGKAKPIWILLKQETVSGSGISWAIRKSAPRSRQITTPAPHHSVFAGRMPFLPPNQQCQSNEGSTLQRNGNDSSLPYHCLYNMHSTKSTILTTHAFYVTDT